MGLDHTRNTAMSDRHPGQFSSIAPGATCGLRWFAGAAFEGPESFFDQVCPGVGWRCDPHPDPRLLCPDMGHKKIWRDEVWRLGMYAWIPRCLLVGTLGHHHRTCRGCLYRGVVGQTTFSACDESGLRFVRGFSPGLFAQTGHLFFNAVLYF